MQTFSFTEALSRSPPHSSVDGRHNSSVQARPARDNSKCCLLLVYLYCFVINLSFILETCSCYKNVYVKL